MTTDNADTTRKRALLTAATRYKSGPDPCNSLYMGGLLTFRLCHALRVGYPCDDLPGAIAAAPDQRIEDAYSVMDGFITSMREDRDWHFKIGKKGLRELLVYYEIALPLPDAPAPAVPAEVLDRLLRAIDAEQAAWRTYLDTPSDRGGRNGPQGKAVMAWHEAKAEVDEARSALARLDAAAAPAAPTEVREALEEIDAVAVDYGYYEAAARTMQEIARSALARLDAAAAPAAPTEVPSGAIHNAMALAHRLENIYDFQCEAGPLRQCVEWQELVRCLHAFADYDAALVRLDADAPSPALAVPAEVRFLLERLDEWSNNHLTDEAARDWLGHVAPAIARVRARLDAAAGGEGGHD